MENTIENWKPTIYINTGLEYTLTDVNLSLYIAQKNQLKRLVQPTIPNKNIMKRAASMDNPAPDNDASVKSLGIFL